MAYFNVVPSDIEPFGSSLSVSHAFESAVPRRYVSHSVRVVQATLTDRPIDVGTLIDPSFDTDATIRMGMPNPFTDPNMSELDRFESALALGYAAREAVELANTPAVSSSAPTDSTSVSNVSVVSD